jgi:hypothetical protein
MQVAQFVAASSCAAMVAPFFSLEEREMCNQLDMLQECRRTGTSYTYFTLVFQ